MAWPIPTSGEAMVSLKGRVGSNSRFRRKRRSASSKFAKSEKIWMPYSVLGNTMDPDRSYMLNGGHPIGNRTWADDEGRPWYGANAPFMPVNFWHAWAGLTVERSAWNDGATLLRCQGSIPVTVLMPGGTGLPPEDQGDAVQDWYSTAPRESFLLYQWRLVRSDELNQSDLSPVTMLNGIGDGSAAGGDLLAWSVERDTSKQILSHGLLRMTMDFTGLNPYTPIDYVPPAVSPPITWMNTLVARMRQSTRIPMPKIPKTGFRLDGNTRLQLICQLRRADGWIPYTALPDAAEPAWEIDNGQAYTFPQDTSVISHFSPPGTGSASGGEPEQLRVMCWPHLRFLLAR